MYNLWYSACRRRAVLPKLWIACPRVIEYGHAEGYVHFEVPKFISLGVIVVIFGLALAYALLKERAERRGGAAAGDGDRR